MAGEWRILSVSNSFQAGFKMVSGSFPQFFLPPCDNPKAMLYPEAAISCHQLPGSHDAR
jgi:hypothetical protein